MEVGLFIYVEETLLLPQPLTADNTLVTVDSTSITADATQYNVYTDTTRARRMDLFNDEKISVTSSIQNINDISKVFTDYSQSFTIPATKNNNSIFRHWYENKVDNGFNQLVRYSGYITINGEVFRVGKWQIESASVKDNRILDYKITFYGNLKSMLDSFG